jgi:Glycoside hydrolase family 44
MRQLIAAAWFGCLGLIACSGDDAAGAAGTAGKAGTPESSAGSGASGATGAGAAGGARAGSSGSHAGSGGTGARAGAGGSHAGSGGARGAAGSAAGSGGSDQSIDLPTLSPPVQPGDPGSADVTLTIRTDQPLRAISPLIYGTNGTPDGARTKPTVPRSGGNRLTAYNWENNASNAGSDYMFQNDNYLSDSSDPAKPIVDGVLSAAMNGAQAVVTVPIVDYVSGDKTPGGDVRNSGSDYLTTRFKQNKPDKGSALSAMPDTTDAFVYEDEFVAYVKAHAPNAHVLFSLDNEPDLWSSTHAEVHPNPVTYAELWDRNQRFATAIKRAWPGAPVLGFVSYGWTGYTSLQNAPDASGRDFIEWYLDQAKAAAANGGRLIDYLDLHWYPEAQGSSGTRITEASTAADVVSAREQAPRSLWDSTYNEKSWIQHDALNGPINLLPRILAKIAAHYPGTRLSFSEWNYGGGSDISGAIASADVLGIFGRDGVSLATFWPLSDAQTFAYAAFRAYRNFDGQGAKFGDTSVRATSSDITSVSVYASLQASAPDDVVLIAINRATADKTVGVRLSHPSVFASLQIHQLAGTTAELSAKPDLPSAAKNAWKITLPAQSVSVLVPHK